MSNGYGTTNISTASVVAAAIAPVISFADATQWMLNRFYRLPLP
jgi:hypothetical protein